MRAQEERDPCHEIIIISDSEEENEEKMETVPEKGKRKREEVPRTIAKKKKSAASHAIAWIYRRLRDRLRKFEEQSQIEYVNEVVTKMLKEMVLEKYSGCQFEMSGVTEDMWMEMHGHDDNMTPPCHALCWATGEEAWHLFKKDVVARVKEEAANIDERYWMKLRASIREVAETENRRISEMASVFNVKRTPSQRILQGFASNDISDYVFLPGQFAFSKLTMAQYEELSDMSEKKLFL